MGSESITHIILCGGALLPRPFKNVSKSHIHKFNYDKNNQGQNVNMALPHFVKQLNGYFPERTKDLLEVAGYVYAADRMTKRGRPDQVEYHSWSRQFHFFIKVRDHKFWQRKSVGAMLNKLLTFVSGDIKYNFTFLEGGKDVGQGNLFDNKDISVEKQTNSAIALFSGGLDSLAGALELLNTTNKNLLLISHHSNNFVVTHIQKNIFNLLNNDFPGRLQRFSFSCNLHGERAVEETQRTRIFLYTAIAYSLIPLTSEKKINVFENGMTSLNFYKRQDMMNARASRTTHPQTISLLQGFFSAVSSSPVTVSHPFFSYTKTDVFNVIKKYNKLNYLNSTITCTKTFNVSNKVSPSTHCGECSQCIDRRFASYAADVEDYDVVYDTDISKDSMKEDEGYTHLCDYIYMAHSLSNIAAIQFPYEMLDVLSEIVPFLSGTDTEKVANIYELTQRHSQQVLSALQKIRSTENLSKPKKPKSIFSFIDDRLFLKSPVERLIDKICNKINVGLPIAFERNKPNHENVLNDQINALIMSESHDYEREFPVMKFSFARTIPDHSFCEYDLLLEAKLMKKTTGKSRITDEIGSDIHKYGSATKLFIIYDPERKIVNEDEFKKDFQNIGGCHIHIIR
jgi:hypothetical protein